MGVLAALLEVNVTSDSRVTTDVRLNHISLVSFIFNSDFPVFNLLLINDAQVESRLDNSIVCPLQGLPYV